MFLHRPGFCFDFFHPVSLNGMPYSRSGFYPALTGLRSAAATMVFLHHTVPGNPAFSVLFQRICLEFHSGVGIFFVLSGFLIHHRYAEHFAGGLQGYRNYLLARLSRIFPLFSLLTLIFYAASWQKAGVSFLENSGSLLLSLSMINGFFDSLKFTGLPQAWSLTVEFSFYLLAPILFYRFQSGIHFYLILSALLLSGCYLLPMLFPAAGFADQNFGSSFLAGFTFAGRSFEFFAGCFLSMFFQKSGRIISGPKPVFTLAGIAGFAGCIWLLAGFQSGHTAGDFHPAGRMLNNALMPIFTTLFLYGLLSEKSIVQWFFSSRILRFAGRISFAFFLLQVGPFQQLAAYFISRNLLVQFIFLQVVAASLFYYIEQPAGKWLRGNKVLLPETNSSSAAC